MNTRIEIQSEKSVDDAFVTQVRKWSTEVLERNDGVSTPPFMSVTIWKTVEELQRFYRKEKEALGVGTIEDAEFLATHEAWRGYPRIHICQERVRHMSDAVLQGILHHEIGHALLHGTPEFYTFRYTVRLQEAGLRRGLNQALLQQCVYLLSVAVKDGDVVTYLAGIGLGHSQLALMRHLIIDTDEERRLWSMVCDDPAKRKLALAAFVKLLVPIEVMISSGIKGAEDAKNAWNEAYRWLSKSVQERLFRFSHAIMVDATKPFQSRLEQATLHLITDSSL